MQPLDGFPAFDLIIIIILGEEYKSRSFLLFVTHYNQNIAIRT
jgi:hypothetical protein